jgi:acyl carrier protein
MKLTEQKIIDLFESVFKQPKGTITPETPLEFFVKDSMDVIEFIAILKNKHHVVIEPTEIVSLTTTEEMVSYILAHQEN